MLFLAVVRRQMSFEFHRIMENSTDADQIGLQDLIEEQVPGLPHYAAFVSRTLTTMTKMIAQHTLSEFGAFDASCSPRHGGNIAHRRHEQAFIAQPCESAELFVSPRENPDNVRTSRGGKAEIGHLG